MRWVSGVLFNPKLAGEGARAGFDPPGLVDVLVATSGPMSGRAGFCGTAQLWTSPDGCIGFTAPLLKELPEDVSHAFANVKEHRGGRALFGTITLTPGLPSWKMPTIEVTDTPRPELITATVPL